MLGSMQINFYNFKILTINMRFISTKETEIYRASVTCPRSQSYKCRTRSDSIALILSHHICPFPIQQPFQSGTLT